MKKKIPQIKKDIIFFLTSEEAKITKKSALKVGLGLLIAHYIFQSTNDAFGHQSHTQSLNVIRNPNKQGEHAAGAVHSSHGVHGNHSEGGWC